MIHITCNMGRRDLPDIYALSPRASGIHIRQIPPAHVTTFTNDLLAGLLVDFKDLIILERSKHISYMHAIF